MNKKILIGIGIALVVIIALFTFLPKNSISDNLSSKNTIEYSNENSSVKIIRDNSDKTANLEISIFIESQELQKSFVNATTFTTALLCKTYQKVFFSESGPAEFSGSIGEAMRVKSGNPEENPLKGYTVERVDFYLKGIENKETLSECTITGPEESDISMNIK